MTKETEQRPREARMVLNDKAQATFDEFKELDRNKLWFELLNKAEELLAKVQKDETQLKAVALTFKGVALYNMQNKQQALADWNEANQILPSWHFPFLIRAKFLFDEKKHGEALANIDQAVELAPQVTVSLIARSYIRQANGNLQGAIEDAKKVLEIDPKNTTALKQVAGIQLMMGNLRSAGEHFEKIVELDPKDFGSLANLSSYYAQTGKLEKALETIRAALEIAPNESRLLVQFGNILGALGRQQEAYTNFKKAISINPNDLEAYRQMELARRAIEGIQKTAIQISDPSELRETYDKLINSARHELNKYNQYTTLLAYILLLVILFIWFAVYGLQSGQGLNAFQFQNNLGAHAQQNFNALEVGLKSISATLVTSFLVSPLIWLTRQNQVDRKTVRSALEDYIRNQIILRFVATYHSNESSEKSIVKQAMDHLDRRGIAQDREMAALATKKNKKGRTSFKNLFKSNKLNERLVLLESQVAELISKN